MNGNAHGFIFAEQKSYCTNHQGQATREGGKWIVSKDGKTRRWMCAACLENRSKHLKAA